MQVREHNVAPHRRRVIVRTIPRRKETAADVPVLQSEFFPVLNEETCRDQQEHVQGRYDANSSVDSTQQAHDVQQEDLNI